MTKEKWLKSPIEGYAIIVSGAMYFYAIYYITLFPFPELVAPCIVAGLFMLLTIPMNRRYKNLTLTSNYMITVGYTLVTYSLGILDGKYSTGFSYIALGPLIAGFSQTRYVFFWFFIAVLIYLGIYFADTYGYIHPVRLEIELRSQNILIDSIVLTFIIAAVTLLYVKNRTSQYEAIKQKHTQIESLVKVIAHDIANPLNLISFSVSRAIKRGLDDDLISKINRSIKSIQAIIAQSKALQAIESGKVPLQMVNNVNLKNLVVHSIEVFEESLKAKSLEVDLTALNETHTVRLDPTIFQNQVLNNLISNAIKFSHEGGKIQITSQPAANSSNKLCLIVRDFGVGMERQTLESAANPDSIKSTHGTQGESGTGFGLSIVKKYVEHMDGQINITSESFETSPENSGTSITITLTKAA